MTVVVLVDPKDRTVLNPTVDKTDPVMMVKVTDAEVTVTLMVSVVVLVCVVVTVVSTVLWLV